MTAPASFEVVSNHSGTITLCLGRRSETRFSHAMNPQETEELGRALLRAVKAPAIEKVHGHVVEPEDKEILQTLKKEKKEVKGSYTDPQDFEEGEKAVEEEDDAKAARHELMQRYMSRCPFKTGTKKRAQYYGRGFYYIKQGKMPPKE